MRLARSKKEQNFDHETCITHAFYCFTRESKILYKKLNKYKNNSIENSIEKQAQDGKEAEEEQISYKKDTTPEKPQSRKPSWNVLKEDESDTRTVHATQWEK